MVLYDSKGSRVRAIRSRPEPNPDTEARVRKVLKSLDALLDIAWFPHAVFNQQHREFEGRYALTCKWPQTDKRWELYQKGEIEDPVDMFGWFCTDMQDASSTPVEPDSIERKVLELLAECDSRRISHATRMKQIVEKNADLRHKRKAEVLEQAAEIAGDLHRISGRVTTTTFERIKQEIIEEANA